MGNESIAYSQIAENIVDTFMCNGSVSALQAAIHMALKEAYESGRKETIQETI